MTNTRSLLRYRFVACAEQMGSVRQKLRDTLSHFQPSEIDANCVVLAVGEACMNIIQHAYGPADQGDIVLEVLQEEPKTNGAAPQLLFRLTDFAKRRSRAAELKSRPLDDIRPGGLGCYIMKEVMDEVSLLEGASASENILEMRKALTTTTK